MHFYLNSLLGKKYQKNYENKLEKIIVLPSNDKRNRINYDNRVTVTVPFNIFRKNPFIEVKLTRHIKEENKNASKL